MRLLWLTDLHLNFVQREDVLALLREIAGQAPDALVISGDTGEAPSIYKYLQVFEQRLQKPVYFVLGNHDFYFSSIGTVRKVAARLSDRVARLHWLGQGVVVRLTGETGLIGHDGWADGRLGDFANSTVFLNDYRLIEDFKGLDDAARLAKLNALGDEAAEYVRGVLPVALNLYRQVILVTHVPPFEAACLHKGQPAGSGYLPHYASRALGEALLPLMEAHPDNQLILLCGHTHSKAQVRLLPNLLVLVGKAAYGEPAVQRVFDLA